MLIQGNCTKRVFGKTSLSLEAKAGESFLLNRIYCEPNAADTYLVLRVDRKTVGVYRVSGKAGNHLGHIGSQLFPLNITDFLASKGINVTVPIAEGQTFSIDSINAGTEIVLVYDTYSAGDISAVMPNGSDAKEYTFLQYMEASLDLAADGDLLLDVSLSPKEFPDFPCGKNVPARHAIQMLGLVGNPYNNGDGGADTSRTTFVKLVKDRETLFDQDRAGIVFRGGYSDYGYEGYHPEMSLIGGVYQPQEQTSSVFANGKPLIFEPALSFVSGEELLVYATCIKGTTRTLLGNVIDLAAILNVKVE